MGQTDFDETPTQNLFKQNVDTCAYSSHIRKLWWCKKLERQTPWRIDTQDPATFGSLKSSRSLQVKEQLVEPPHPGLNVRLGRKEAGYSFRDCPALPRSL